jgi:hypothetical protein
VTSLAAVVAHNPELAERHKQELYTALERTEEVVVAHKAAAEVGQAAHSTVVVAVPIVVVRKVVAVAERVVAVARKAAVAADLDPAAVVDLDHKTYVNSSCMV